jgi:ABC-type dipeptide/oligopeptide/nickel transport system ATPase component
VIRYLARRTYVMREGEFVEAGETEQVFGNPRHAYTRTLIASIPGRQKHGPS